MAMSVATSGGASRVPVVPPMAVSPLAAPSLPPPVPPIPGAASTVSASGLASEPRSPPPPDPPVEVSPVPPDPEASFARPPPPPEFPPLPPLPMPSLDREVPSVAGLASKRTPPMPPPSPEFEGYVRFRQAENASEVTAMANFRHRLCDPSLTDTTLGPCPRSTALISIPSPRTLKDKTVHRRNDRNRALCTSRDSAVQNHHCQ
jgi:hypothetical protein